MTFGIPTPLFLALHVAVSLLAIAAGLIVVVAMAGNRHLKGWAGVFLALTVLTCLTGFPLPPFGIDPPRIFGFITLALCFAAAVALYGFSLSGGWRGTYIVGATGALYLNVFVLIAQSFQKIPPLRALAPTGSEPPFVVAQLAGLALLILLGLIAFRRFRPTHAVYVL